MISNRVYSLSVAVLAQLPLKLAELTIIPSLILEIIVFAAVNEWRIKKTDFPCPPRFENTCIFDEYKMNTIEFKLDTIFYTPYDSSLNLHE